MLCQKLGNKFTKYFNLYIFWCGCDPWTRGSFYLGGSSSVRKVVSWLNTTESAVISQREATSAVGAAHPRGEELGAGSTPRWCRENLQWLSLLSEDYWNILDSYNIIEHVERSFSSISEFPWPVSRCVCSQVELETKISQSILYSVLNLLETSFPALVP